MSIAFSRPGGPQPGPSFGNLTVNHYSRLELDQNSIQIHYIVDMAEIPAFRELGRMDRDGDGEINASEQGDYLAATAKNLRLGQKLSIDGAVITTVLRSSDLATPPGQAGLKTLRLSFRYEAHLLRSAKTKPQRLRYQDNNFGNRLGWKEIVVRPMPGIRLLKSDVSATDKSDELRRYPKEPSAVPMDVSKANVTFASGRMPGLAQADIAVRIGAKKGRPDPLAKMLTADHLTLPLMLIALITAAGLGALHAMSPGHGKAIVGAFLVGSRGTAKHALILGLTVTLTHTTGVFTLGLITLGASRYFLPEQIFPWLAVASGLIVAGLGLTMLGRRWRGTGHHYPHDDHDHDHGGFTRCHSHHHHHHQPVDSGQAASGTSLTWRSLLAMGVSGGLLPCPSALVVLLGAIALQRIGFGLLLIVAFSLGLAAVLTIVGILFMHARQLFSRIPRSHALLNIIPMASAVVITLAGIGITVQGAWRIF